MDMAVILVIGIITKDHLTLYFPWSDDDGRQTIYISYHMSLVTKKNLSSGFATR